MHFHGERLQVAERMIVSPAVGVFRPFGPEPGGAGRPVRPGEAIGVVEGPGRRLPVRSAFAGTLVAILTLPGERVGEGQPVAWLRVA